MPHAAITESIDVAQVVLYAFWAFFFGLIFWLRREDRREGYPLESETTHKRLTINPVLIPRPKTFILPHGGTVESPNFARDERPILAERNSAGAGSTLEPTGDPMLSGVGPASYANRADEIEQTREGHDLIVPMRVAGDFSVNAGPDPRGWKVIASDGESPGTVKELWVDRADVMVRYLEVEIEGGQVRLLPITMVRLKRSPNHVEVKSVKAAHFKSVPALKNPNQVSVLEEEKISAFYAGGRLYSDPKRLGPVL